ncbi:unnamed protein product [Durusdinium trenchii]|uniref:Uncharacterized protein n=2 Tax=Durusdinium trenchii TaxID=1381693 RepID=A0ABP0QSR8_9DINO
MACGGRERPARFACIRELFLQRLKSRKRRRADPDRRPVRLEHFGNFRVIGFYGAAERLQQLQEKQRARQHWLDCGSMVPVTPEYSRDSKAESEEAAEPKEQKRKRRRPTDVLLQQLVEKRQREADAEQQQASEEEVRMVAMEMRQVRVKLKRMARDAKNAERAKRMEWLLLQRIEPEPVLLKADLCDEERQAQNKEELDHRVWELYGGADKEEHVYREWRRQITERRKSCLLRRATARWFRPADHPRPRPPPPEKPLPPKLRTESKDPKPRSLQEKPCQPGQLHPLELPEVSETATEDPYMLL